jgi:phospholipid-translocating ATPase
MKMLQIFVVLLSLCLVCTICDGIWETKRGFYFQSFLPWESFVPSSVLQSPPTADKKGSGATIISILIFFSYIIILNTLVPISLYVR